MNNFLRELRYVGRVLRKNPAFTLVVVGTLALGMGATAAMFTVVHGVILQPLPFQDSEELVVFWERKDGNQWPVSAGNVLDWKERSKSLEAIAIADLFPMNLTGEGPPLRVHGAKVSSDFFEMLRVPPALGRVFRDGEDTPGQERVAILSHGLWQRGFGGQGDVLQKEVKLDDVSYEVIGVMPESFDFPYLGELQEIWVPRVVTEWERSQAGRSMRGLGAIGRLVDGVTPTVAHQELKSIAKGLGEEHPLSNSGWSVDVVSLYRQVVKESGSALFLFLGAVSFLLLIALVNVANLMMARNSVRLRETSLRVALGSGRARIARQFMTESLVLSLLAGGLGLLLAQIAVRILRRFNPGDIPRLAEIQLDGTVIAFVLGLSVVVGLLLGLIPVVGLGRLNYYACLKEGGGKATASRSALWARNLLLTLETALVLVLLMAGGLMIQGFQRLMDVDPGFAVEERIAVEVPLMQTRYPEKQQKQQFFEGLQDELAAVPGVRRVGLVSSLPLSPKAAISLGFVEEGKTVDLANVPIVGFDVATPDFFEAAGIPLISGRMFNDQDREGAQDVLLVNETMAQRFWPNEDPIGKRLQIRDPEGPWVEIIGVVGDVKDKGLTSDSRASMFQPLAQMAIDRATMHAVVEAAPGQAGQLPTLLREAVWRQSAEQTVQVRLLEELAEDSVLEQRFHMLLLVMFSLIALLLGAVGIYGVVSYSVNQQRKAIGIRTALGAQRSDVFRWIGVKGFKPVAIGIALGIVAALLLGKLIAKILYEVSPSDPLTLLVVSLLLATVAGVAVFFPARRATRVDPLTVLRAE